MVGFLGMKVWEVWDAQASAGLCFQLRLNPRAFTKQLLSRRSAQSAP